jgi:gluconate kinase
LEERIRARTGHFANESILDTQLSTLQLPTDEVFTGISQFYAQVQA